MFLLCEPIFCLPVTEICPGLTALNLWISEKFESIHVFLNYKFCEPIIISDSKWSNQSFSKSTYLSTNA